MINLGARLYSAVPYLSMGCRIADIGTDHAYLPIFLLQSGIAKEALACDINEGPIESARANIAEVGLCHAIKTRLCDGLHGVEAFFPDHILIFGMGGELIMKIIEEAPWVKADGIRLVMQPMSRANLLRAYLLENGFSIVGETVSFEDKYYQTIVAEYTGRVEHYTEEELLLGRLNIRQGGEHFEGFLSHEISVLEAILRGKRQSATADTKDEERILEILRTRLESIT